MRYRIRIRGVTPVICDNGAAGLDTRSAANIEKAQITKKQGSNRTVADDVRLRVLECFVSPYRLFGKEHPNSPRRYIGPLTEHCPQKRGNSSLSKWGSGQKRQTIHSRCWQAKAPTRSCPLRAKTLPPDRGQADRSLERRTTRRISPGSDPPPAQPGHPCAVAAKEPDTTHGTPSIMSDFNPPNPRIPAGPGLCEGVIASGRPPVRAVAAVRSCSEAGRGCTWPRSSNGSRGGHRGRIGSRYGWLVAS